MSVIEEAKEYQQNFTCLSYRADRIIKHLINELEQRQKVVDNFKSEVEIMETQDTSPEHDAGFADCQQQILNMLEPWPSNSQLSESEGK